MKKCLNYGNLVVSCYSMLYLLKQDEVVLTNQGDTKKDKRVEKEEL